MLRQRGISMVELMLGMFVGMLLFSGAIHVYVSTLGSSDITLKAAKLNQEMRAIMLMLANDVRRAGYWSGSVAGVGATNPFTDNDLGHDLRIAEMTGQSTGSCVTFAYNRNATESGDNPSLVGVAALVSPFDDASRYGVKPNTELFGYRLNNDKVQALVDPATAFDCDNGTWADLNDNDLVSVTALSFSPSAGFPVCTNIALDNDDCNTTGSGDYLVFERSLDISLSARLVADPVFTNSITKTVKIRNDRIVEVP